MKKSKIWRWVWTGVLCLLILINATIGLAVYSGQVVFIKAHGFYPNYEIIAFRYVNFIIYKDSFKTEYVKINKSLRKEIFQAADRVYPGEKIKTYGVLDGTTFEIDYKGAVQSIGVGFPEGFGEKYNIMKSLYDRVNGFINSSRLNEFPN